MRASVISLGLAVIIGIVSGLLLQTPSTPPVSTTANSDTLHEPQSLENQHSNNQLKILRQQLAQEITAREQLQDSVSQLSKKIAKLEMPIAAQNEQEESQIATPHTTPSTNTQARPWFNQQALIDAGVDAQTAQTLKSRYETQELEKLYLRDRATREGWFGSRRYRDEVELLDAQLSGLQKELGDDSYAAYLFATGQANRVTVQSVLAKSSADIAGIRTSDQITRYGDQAIYNWRDLRQATTQGEVNETVTVEVIRDGKPLQLYVQRGPLGIRMSSVSIAP
jgi:predicted phage tail protein